MIQVFETTVRKESFCSGTEVPLVFQSLLVKTAKELEEKSLRLVCFKNYVGVPDRLSSEAISEMCSHIVRIAKKFVGKTGASYLGGEIATKTSSPAEDGRELCHIAVEMIGG